MLALNDEIDFVCICQTLWQKLFFHPIWLLVTIPLLVYVEALELKTLSYGIIRTSWGVGECTWPFRKGSYCWLLFFHQTNKTSSAVMTICAACGKMNSNWRGKNNHHIYYVYWPWLLNWFLFQEATDSYIRQLPHCGNHIIGHMGWIHKERHKSSP